MNRFSGINNLGNLTTQFGTRIDYKSLFKKYDIDGNSEFSKSEINAASKEVKSDSVELSSVNTKGDNKNDTNETVKNTNSFKEIAEKIKATFSKLTDGHETSGNGYTNKIDYDEEEQQLINKAMQEQGLFELSKSGNVFTYTSKEKEKNHESYEYFYWDKYNHKMVKIPMSVDENAAQKVENDRKARKNGDMLHDFKLLSEPFSEATHTDYISLDNGIYAKIIVTDDGNKSAVEVQYYCWDYDNKKMVELSNI